MEFERENPSPLAQLPGDADPHWRDWSPELETAYLQHLAGVENLEDATSLQLVVNTAAGGSIAHLGAILPNLHELNLNGSTLDSLRDLGTGFRLLQVLWVSRCGLKALDGLNGLPALRELYAAYNDITDLQPVDSCQQLEILDVECNCIADPDAVLYLASCTRLQTLTMSGNPAAGLPCYRRTVCTALPSLQSLDDEPVTAADRAGEPGAESQPSPHHHPHSRQDAGGRAPPSGAGSATAHASLPPPPLKDAAAAVAEASMASPSGRSVSVSGGGGPAAAAASPFPPDADEVAFVVAGIKHARVGVDSHEFREIEMNLLVATADGTDVQLDVRPGTSTLLPANASTWVRTLRSSREGSLAALRASHVAAAAASASAGRTGSQSPTSSCSASPIGSRPPSSQQQRSAGTGTAPVPVPQPERWAVPAGPGASMGISSSYGARRPSSGTGICSSSGGGMGVTVDSPMRPGSGGYRPGTGSNRPFSARPGTTASFSARLGTSASTGAAPVSATAGLYWAKNRISGGSGGTSGGGGGADGAGGGGGGAGSGSGDADEVAGSSKLTQGSDTTFGGSFARDLRKWKGAAVRAAAPSSVGGSAAAAPASAGGANGITSPAPAVLGGGNGLSQTLLRGGQLDPKALLEELKRWKLETADKVLFVDPDETAGAEEWAGAEALDVTPGGTLLGNGSAGTAAGGSHRADILRLSDSQDGAAPEAGPFGIGVGLGLALLEQQSSDMAFSPAVPGSPMLQLPRPPPGAAAAGRRKMVLAKVLRDIALDTVIGSGTCISEILAGLRPVHAPSSYSSGGVGRTPGVAWGAPGDSAGERPGNALGSATSTPTHSGAAQGYHRGQPAQGPQPAQQQQQQGGQRSGSARSVCSSSGQSDYGNPAAASGQASSRPGSQEGTGGGIAGGGTSSGGAGGGGGGGGGGGPGGPYGVTLQRQKSASRAPGLPPGPSAPGAAYRVASVAGEVDVRSSNPSPVLRVCDW